MLEPDEYRCWHTRYVMVTREGPSLRRQRRRRRGRIGTCFRCARWGERQELAHVADASHRRRKPYFHWRPRVGTLLRASSPKTVILRELLADYLTLPSVCRLKQTKARRCLTAGCEWTSR